MPIPPIPRTRGIVIQSPPLTNATSKATPKVMSIGREHTRRSHSRTLSERSRMSQPPFRRPIDP
jgi:hypothetical protein